VHSAAAHEAAWRETSLDDDHPRRTRLAVRDPLQRALLSLTLPPFVGITKWAPNSGATQRRPYPWLPTPRDGTGNANLLSMAWALLLLAHCARPVLLFRRAPTFEGFRSTGALVLRWFGTVPTSTPEVY